MTKKFTKLMAVFALFFLLIPGMGWGQTNASYTITAKTGSGDGSQILTSTNVSAVFTETTYPNAFTTATKAYYNGSSGIKLGTSSDSGTLAFSLNQAGQVNAQTITVRAKLYNSSKAATINVNSGTAQSLTSSFADYTFTINQNITSITLASSKYCWISSITVSYEDVTYTVTLADDNTTLTQATPGASVTLPTRSAIGDYAFAGWSTTNVPAETTTAPTIILAGAYTPTADVTLYPVYTRTETNGSPTTEWHLTSLSAADAGVYALLTTDGHAFNGTISSGHGQATDDAFSFTDDVATTAPDGVCEITFVSVSGGFKMYNESKGYLYASAASSGHLAWHSSESSYWSYASSNWKYNSNGAYLRSYNNGSFRTYGQNNGDLLKLAKKVESSGTTTYYWSTPTTGPIINANNPATLAYNATGGEFGYSILNPVTGVTLNAASNSDWITNVAVNATNSTVTFSTSTNTAYTQRTGTITLSYTGATDKVVTITQETAPDPVITANDVNIAFDATSGSISYSITNEPNPAGTMTAAVVSGDIANLTIGAIENNTVAFTCAANNTITARTATVTLTYTYDNNLTVTKDVTITQAQSTFDYAILPFAFDGNATAVADVAGLTQQGLSSYTTQLQLQFNSTDDYLLLRFNERPGQLSYDIKGNSFNGGTFKVQVSADGTTFTDVATYTNLTSDIQHITINNLDANVRYIKWVYTNKSAGNVALGNIALDAYQAPQEYTMTIGTPENVTIHAYYGNNQSATNNHAVSVLSGTTVTLVLSPSSGYVLDLVTVYAGEEENQELISLTPVEGSENTWTFVMPNNNVTVSAVAAETHAPYYYTRATIVEPGRRYVIVAQRNGVYYAMGAQKNNNRDAKPISVEGTAATVIRADVHEFTISSVEEQTPLYSIYDVDSESPGYLYAGSSSSNWLLTESELDANGQWAITVDSETGVAGIVANGSNTRNVMRFNQDNGLFSCYPENNSQSDVYLYVKDDGFELTIDGYTDVTEGLNNKGYYLIASPVEVAPADVPGLTEGTFDLYYYDDSQELEWINYKTPSGINANFGNLVPGKGYLYAKKATTENSTYTFRLSGEVYSGTGAIELEETWNLIGNPWAQEAEFFAEAFYVMNEDGSGLIAGEDYIAQPMQGIFVYDEYGGSTVEFLPSSSGAKAAGLSLNLERGGVSTPSTGSGTGSTTAVIDRAIVRFGEGSQLPKFQLNPNSTKVYIPQGDKDYAVVRSANEGEMPVNFKAERNGTYTLSMNAVDVNFGYLHLIDNMTGTDVDLLATPSYTFDARTTDYDSRFRLVFASVCEDADGDNETFAYYDGSGWIVSNMGEATLQVVDVMGRIINTQNINGNATFNLNETAGIYMLRLVNGNNVKVQKVVVR